MAAARKHLLLLAQGGYVTSGLEAEIWECTLRCSLVYGSTDAVGLLPDNWEPQAEVINQVETDWTITANWKLDDFDVPGWLDQNVAPAFATWLEAGIISSAARLDFIKCSVIGSPSGASVPAIPYAQGSPMTLEWTDSNPVGSTTGQVSPLDTSMCVTHRTAQVGASGRGRMFLPAIPQAKVSNGKFASGQPGAARDIQVALLQDISSNAIGVGAPQIRPIITGGDFTKYAVINQVKVGDVPDTQRRRRNALVETYVSGTPDYS